MPNPEIYKFLGDYSNSYQLLENLESNGFDSVVEAEYFNRIAKKVQVLYTNFINKQKLYKRL